MRCPFCRVACNKDALGARATPRARPLSAGSAPGLPLALDLALAAGDDRIRLLGGVWDQEKLDQLYAHALTYIHGHSVGGTNPSLLRAIGAATAVSAFDVTFNREVLGADDPRTPRYLKALTARLF